MTMMMIMLCWCYYADDSVMILGNERHEGIKLESLLSFEKKKFERKFCIDDGKYQGESFQ